MIAVTFPHSYRPLTAKGIYVRFSIALFPVLIAGILRFGISFLLRVLPVVLFAVLLDGFLEKGLRRRNTVFDVSYFTMLLIVLLPPMVPWYVLAIGVLTTVLIGKWTFGGTGSYWMHPTVAGFLLVFTAFPLELSQAFRVPRYWPRTSVDGSITELLNSHIFGRLGFIISDGIFNHLFGNQTGILGASAVLLILLASVYLLVNDIVPQVFPVIYLGTLLIGMLLIRKEDLLFSVLNAETLLVAFFLLPDPGSRPKTHLGIFLTPLVCGMTTLGFSSLHISSAPIIAYASTNVLTPLIDVVAGRSYMRERDA